LRSPESSLRLSSPPAGKCSDAACLPTLATIIPRKSCENASVAILAQDPFALVRLSSRCLAGSHGPPGGWGGANLLWGGAAGRSRTHPDPCRTPAGPSRTLPDPPAPGQSRFAIPPPPCRRLFLFKAGVTRISVSSRFATVPAGPIPPLNNGGPRPSVRPCGLSAPACLPACLHACLPVCLSACSVRENSHCQWEEETKKTRKGPWLRS
jgi:hypothetical protein